MRSNLFFALIAVFWVVMDVWLWRSQSTSQSQIGSEIPGRIVWEKILTAPDPSTLEVYDHDKKLGTCTWAPTVGNTTQALNRSLSADYVPDGENAEPTGYNLSFDGSFTVTNKTSVLFRAQLRLGTNQNWLDFHLNVRTRTSVWDLFASSATEKMMLKMNSDGASWQRTFRFSEFEHPETVLSELAGTEMPALAALPGLGLTGLTATNQAEGLHWESHQAWMKFGHSRVQVYRLETQLLGQHLYVFISQVGEVLWVEGPQKWTLRNEAFSHF